MELRHTRDDDSIETPIVISLGKAKRKQIKRLKKGKGRLMHEIQLTVEQFKRDQAEDGRDVVPLVFICRERTKSSRWIG